MIKIWINCKLTLFCQQPPSCLPFKINWQWKKSSKHCRELVLVSNMEFLKQGKYFLFFIPQEKIYTSTSWSCFYFLKRFFIFFHVRPRKHRQFYYFLFIVFQTIEVLTWTIYGWVGGRGFYLSLKNSGYRNNTRIEFLYIFYLILFFLIKNWKKGEVCPPVALFDILCI